MPTSPVFEPAVVSAVLAHMNGDHSEDNLLIARAFADPAATAAEMIGIDGTAGRWGYTVGTVDAELRIPWPAPITERAEIRREIVALYDRARERLGTQPHPH